MPMLITTTLTLAETLRRTREQPKQEIYRGGAASRHGCSAQAARTPNELHATPGPGAVPRDAVEGELHERVRYAAHHTAAQTMARMGARSSGLTVSEVTAAHDYYGENIVEQRVRPTLAHRLLDAIANPFSIILAVTALILLVVNPLDAAIIAIMLAIAVALRLATETRSGNAAARLQRMVPSTCRVTRTNRTLTIPVEELVPGDIIHLSAGEIVPADARIIATKNLLIDQSLITGENAPVEKVADSPVLEASPAVMPKDIYDGVAFAGTAVHSGTGTAVVLTTGADTYLGQMARVLDTRAERTTHDAGVSGTARILIRFMLVMVPAVLAVNLLAGRPWIDALLFSAAIVVGITPQLLPAIVSACLARGVLELSRRQVVVKNLSAIQNLSAMDVLCCDKTGTLTEQGNVEDAIAGGSGTGALAEAAEQPRKGVLAATAALGSHGVDIKVLTGDNRRAAAHACHEVGISSRKLMLGPEVDLLTDEQLAARAETARVFAEVTPLQKARIVRVLREHGNHTVGFAGDGANDAPAMRVSDCGIALESTVDVSREAADVILLRDDLMGIDRAVLEGRRSYGNLIKYLKITASSNLGNVLSVLVASAMLPFLPMTALQLIVLSLLYTAVCAAIPWDDVDRSYLERPRAWQPRSVVRFMTHLGPVSTLFDVATFAFLFFALCPAVAVGSWTELMHIGDLRGLALFAATFQSGWFVASFWTQVLVLHALRTERRAVFGARSGVALWTLTALACGICSWLPFTSWGEALGLTPLPVAFFGWLLLMVFGYLTLADVAKRRYIARFGELL